MAVPFLPAALKIPTYSLISTPTLPVDHLLKLEKLKKYFSKDGLIKYLMWSSRFIK